MTEQGGGGFGLRIAVFVAGAVLAAAAVFAWLYFGDASRRVVARPPAINVERPKLPDGPKLPDAPRLPNPAEPQTETR